MEDNATARLRALPPAHALMDCPAGRALLASLPHETVRSIVREVLETLRSEVLAGRVEADREVLTRRAMELLRTQEIRARTPKLRRVINATGVVLHTNLGRAPLSEEVLAHVVNVARGYATLEYDLARGRRGHRDRLISELCASLVGAEDALVVNNNAAAVLLTATALAAGREVIVSRGELVEIGGGFRIPEILEACGARLVEVGTTNRTRVQDYARALSPATAMILKVHRSNFTLVGFTEEASIAELVALGRQHGVPVVEDLGSGALIDTRTLGLPAEPMARRSIASGADLVMFSGDKLLGGPQAGLIVGRKSWIDILRRHPLARAMRPGRLVLAALEATLRIYAAGRADQAIPVIAMLGASPEKVRRRAEILRAAVGEHPGVTIEATEARVGGGAMPTAKIASWGVAIEVRNGAEAVRLERALREVANPPVIARITEGKVVLDARTIADDEIELAAAGLARALAEVQVTTTNGAHAQPKAEYEDRTSDPERHEFVEHTQHTAEYEDRTSDPERHQFVEFTERTEEDEA